MKKIKVLVILTLIITNIFANQAQVENFVERFYQNILERHSDASGLKNWTEELLSGEKSGSDIAKGFIFSQEFQNRGVTNEEFITILYRAFFGREPDNSGFNSWKNSMDNGMSQEEVLDGFLNSLEFDNLCKEYGILATETSQIEENNNISNVEIAKIDITNRAYSTHNIVGIYITASEDKSWGDNYIDFQLYPNFHLSNPIEISNCSNYFDIKYVYDNNKKFVYKKIYIKCNEDYHWGINDKGIEFKYENTFAYNQQSRYKNYLEECPLYNFNINNIQSCTLSQLPLIAQESNIKTPTKYLIMSRVVVSKKWMGDRFAELLDVLDSDIKQLLGAVTAIVIDDDINPSFYRSSTGAIYLNPRGLWLTPEEAETIIDKDDYRSSYGNELKFDDYWRYIKNNSEYAYRYTDWKYKEHNTTRTIDDIKYGFARLLYHELAHANDFIPPNSIDNLQNDIPISSITWNNYKNGRALSDKLYSRSPLNSQKLIDMGQVLYRGVEATEEQKNMSAEDIGLLFERDVANDMYSYSTQREDLAKLFETTMLKYHYGFEMDIGFIKKPKDENPSYKDYILGWGARNRIAEPEIADRAMFVVNSILPDKTDWSEFFAKDVGEVKLLDAGKNWWDSIVIGNSETTLRKATRVPDIREIYFREVKD